MTKQFRSLLQTSGPQTPVQDGPCGFTITWLTAAACPLTADTDTPNSCTARDPNSDYTFNLEYLEKAGPFSIQAGDKTFLVGSQSAVDLPGRLMVDSRPSR